MENGPKAENGKNWTKNANGPLPEMGKWANNGKKKEFFGVNFAFSRQCWVIIYDFRPWAIVSTVRKLGAL